MPSARGRPEAFAPAPSYSRGWIFVHSHWLRRTRSIVSSTFQADVKTIATEVISGRSVGADGSHVKKLISNSYRARSSDLVPSNRNLATHRRILCGNSLLSEVK